MEGMSLKPCPETVLGELEDALLGAIDDLFGFVGVVDGLGDGELRDVDESAQQRLVAHDADVVLDAGAVGNAVDERRQVGDAADRFDLFAAIELLGERDHVNRAAGVLQIAHAGEDAAMRVEREVVGLEFGGLIVEQAVEQDRAEDGALGFQCWQGVRVRECSRWLPWENYVTVTDRSAYSIVWILRKKRTNFRWESFVSGNRGMRVTQQRAGLMPMPSNSVRPAGQPPASRTREAQLRRRSTRASLSSLSLS